MRLLIPAVWMDSRASVIFKHMRSCMWMWEGMCRLRTEDLPDPTLATTVWSVEIRSRWEGEKKILNYA